nr:uncharacterized protein LOC119161806 [Rhipicephalus microplus]
MTLHSTVTLVEKLLKCGFCYVLVGNFGQDHLERFFGIARHVAGAGGQPTVQQFLFIYRLLSVNNLIRPPQRASVEGDGPSLLLKMQYLFQHKEPIVNQIDTLPVLFDDILLEPAEYMQDMIHPESTRDCVLDYLGGYVAKKFAEISCKDCLQTLRRNSREPTALTAIKTRGFVQVPSEQLLRLLQIVEEHVEMRTIDNIACANIYMNIVENILRDDRTSSASVGCGTHFVSTTAEVVHFFITAHNNQPQQAENQQLTYFTHTEYNQA